MTGEGTEASSLSDHDSSAGFCQYLYFMSPHSINVTQQQLLLLNCQLYIWNLGLSGSQGLQELVKDCLSPVFLLLGLVAIPPEPEKVLAMPEFKIRTLYKKSEPEYCEK